MEKHSFPKKLPPFFWILFPWPWILKDLIALKAVPLQMVNNVENEIECVCNYPALNYCMQDIEFRHRDIFVCNDA